jgi:tetratricopeptide (TPR) repeat protein
MQKDVQLEIGRSKLRIARFKEAHDAFQAAVDLDGEYADAWYGKATALEGLGRYSEAIDAYERTASLAPAAYGAIARFSIANNRVNLGDLGRALDDFDAALAENPMLERAWHNRALVLADLGRLEEATVSFARAAALDPADVRIALIQGYYLARLGRREQAEACYARAEASRSQADLARMWSEIGARLVTRRELEPAVEVYERASRMLPRWGIPWLGRGDALRRLGQVEPALASFERAIASNDEATLLGWAAKAEVFLEQGRPAAARAAYARIVGALRPRSGGDYRARARAFRALGQLDAALKAIAKAIEIDRSDPSCLMEQAVCLEQASRYADALGVLEQAVLRFPTFAEAWRRLAVRAVAAGNHERAIACADKAVGLGDASTAVVMAKGAALFALGRVEDAAACFETLVAREPRSQAACFNLGVCRTRMGQSTDALQTFDRALALGTDMDTLRAKSQVLIDLGREREANSIAALGLALQLLGGESQQTDEVEAQYVARVQQSVALDSDNLLAGRLYGEILLKAGQLEEADKLFARWTAAWPDDDLVWGQRAIVHSKLNRPAEATAFYEKAILANPRSARALRNAAIDALEHERYAEALDYQLRSLAIEGENSNALYGVGASKAHLGKLAEAVDAFRQAVAIDPNDIGAWKDMTTYLTWLGRYGEAAEAWKTVRRLDPTIDPAGNLLESLGHDPGVQVLPGLRIVNDGSTADADERRGTALLARDDHRGAADAFDAALVRNPGNAEVWIERGLCAEILEGSERAIAFFDRALSIDPDLPRALYNKGVSLIRLKRPAEAIDAYQRLLTIYDARKLPVDRDLVHGCYNLALACTVVGELERALDCFDRVLVIARLAPGTWEEEARRARTDKETVFGLARMSARPDGTSPSAPGAKSTRS